MKVIFISECSKKALRHTRRILDQFAPRKGRRTWITDLTLEGLNTVHALLKKKARRNTAVICYSFFGRSMKVQFTVGRSGIFDSEGNVATETTQAAVTHHYADERISPLGNVISQLSRLAGLFHDFGKASPFFQEKLRSPGQDRDEIRHEYLSALFIAHVGTGCGSNEEFLRRLADVTAWQRPLHISFSCSAALPPEDCVHLDAGRGILLGQLPLVCRMLMLLCLTHHRLPELAGAGPDADQKCQALQGLDSFLESSGFSPDLWNYLLAGVQPGRYRDITIAQDSLYHSSTFCKALLRALGCLMPQLEQCEQLFVAHREIIFHYARLSLMLSDHVCSSRHSKGRHHDPQYQAWANTRHGALVYQYLDDHVCLVSRQAGRLAPAICNLRSSLLPLSAVSALQEDSPQERFAWQNRASNAVRGIASEARQRGFFGVNIASTGAGKTTANARIMHTLSAEGECRFTYAIPLRTLTLQTGRALQERLGLGEQEVAIRIGSSSLQALSDLLVSGPGGAAGSSSSAERDADAHGAVTGNTDGQREAADAGEEPGMAGDMVTGSDLSAALDCGITCCAIRNAEDCARGPDSHFIHGLLRTKFGENCGLFMAPALVCTVDYLAGASEGTRGGRQILGMLRLLSGDVVLDEPDELDLCSQIALCRLAFFSGMCGSRLLVSSASLQPSLVRALFMHYRQGRELYNRAHGIVAPEITCAGVCSEFVCHMEHDADEASFQAMYANQVAEHAVRLADAGHAWQRGAFLEVALPKPAARGEERRTQACAAMSSAMHAALLQLSGEHFSQDRATGIRVTTALIRIANIRTLVPVARALLGMNLPPDLCLHCCIYHAQFPAVQRAMIERELDALLGRAREPLLGRGAVTKAMESCPWARHHLFVVIASPVIEIGRDLDFDCAILEPSSFRALVQAAGRVQRHRQHASRTPNILVLSQNFRALSGYQCPYSRPGYETAELQIADRRLSCGLDGSFLDPLQASLLLAPAVPEIQPHSNYSDSGLNLLTLERAASTRFMEREGIYFLQSAASHYCALAQQYFPFRGNDRRYQLEGLVTISGENVEIREIYGSRVFSVQREHRPDFGSQVRFFGNTPLNEALEKTAGLSDIRPHDTYRNNPFAQICLTPNRGDLANGLQKWRYSDLFGFYC